MNSNPFQRRKTPNEIIRNAVQQLIRDNLVGDKSKFCKDIGISRLSLYIINNRHYENNISTGLINQIAGHYNMDILEFLKLSEKES